MAKTKILSIYQVVAIDRGVRRAVRVQMVRLRVDLVKVPARHQANRREVCSGGGGGGVVVGDMPELGGVLARARLSGTPGSEAVKKSSRHEYVLAMDVAKLEKAKRGAAACQAALQRAREAADVVGDATLQRCVAPNRGCRAPSRGASAS